MKSTFLFSHYYKNPVQLAQSIVKPIKYNSSKNNSKKQFLYFDRWLVQNIWNDMRLNKRIPADDARWLRRILESYLNNIKNEEIAEINKKLKLHYKKKHRTYSYSTRSFEIMSIIIMEIDPHEVMLTDYDMEYALMKYAYLNTKKYQKYLKYYESKIFSNINA